jgi:nucleotide-binding universal stress UspA family protein
MPANPALGFRRILVPIDGSDASLDAVAVACTIAKRNKGQVIVVHVIEVQRSLPLDADMAAEAERGEGFLQRAERIAEDQDFDGLEGELLQARDAGHAIVDEAAERNVDAIFLGMHYRAPLTDVPQVWPAKGEPMDIAPPAMAPLGDVTQYVLKYSSCAVWVLRRGAGQ